MKQVEAGLLPVFMAVAPAEALGFRSFHKDMQEAAPKWHAQLHANALCPHAHLPALQQVMAGASHGTSCSCFFASFFFFPPHLRRSWQCTARTSRLQTSCSCFIFF